MRLRTILDPRKTREIGATIGKRDVRLSDYVAVPAIATYGTWPVAELIAPDMHEGLMYYANWLAAR